MPPLVEFTLFRLQQGLLLAVFYSNTSSKPLIASLCLVQDVQACDDTLMTSPHAKKQRPIASKPVLC